MVASSKAEIRNLLYGHYEFGECVIEDVRWRDQGATIDLLLNYVWSDADGFAFDGQRFSVKDGRLRSDLDTPLVKTLRFHLVQEFHAHNWWNAAIVSADVLNWGASEVAAIRVQDDSLFLSKYRSHPVDFHHVTAF